MDVSQILETICAEAARGDLVFPTHTEIAVRVQHMLDDPDCSVDTLGKLVSADPLLAARVLGMANSLACNPGGRTVTDLKNAISRLGFTTLRALAASIIVRQMKDMSRIPEHRQLASRLWEHTANVAALARVIARRVTRQNPDVAFFTGIVHEVGSFYLISRADSFPGLLNGRIEAWHDSGEVTIGRAVLHALDIPVTIIEAMETAWSGFLAMPPASLGDTLLLANQLSPIESPLDELAGMSRKGMDVELEMVINDETLTSILAESAAEVASLTEALRA